MSHSACNTHAPPSGVVRRDCFFARETNPVVCTDVYIRHADALTHGYLVLSAHGHLNRVIYFTTCGIYQLCETYPVNRVFPYKTHTYISREGIV
jgi:hypothetical protein